MISEIELDLLGAALSDPRLTASLQIASSDFERPAHGAVWEAMRTVHAAGNVPTPPLILEATNRMGIKVDPGVFPGLVGRGMAVNADTYAARILDESHRRRIYDALTTAAQKLKTSHATDEIVTEMTSRIGVTTQAESDSEGLLTLGEFVNQELPPEEWVIPDLIAKGDRVVVTGQEGGGKSQLLRQISICAAAGMNPFTFAGIPERRVLVVDAENPERIMIQRFRELRTAVMDKGLSTGNRMWIRRAPQGLDLSRTRDRLWLHHQCMLTNPDLLMIGPAYKLYIGGASVREEDLARQVTSVLDGLREEFGFALLLEHHSPHGAQGQQRETRPIGSSLWRRWPEFGLGLAPTDSSTHTRREAEVVHWRLGRDFRPWPKHLQTGSDFPWVDCSPEQTVRNLHLAPDWTPHRIVEETRV